METIITSLVETYVIPMFFSESLSLQNINIIFNLFENFITNKKLDEIQGLPSFLEELSDAMSCYSKDSKIISEEYSLKTLLNSEERKDFEKWFNGLWGTETADSTLKIVVPAIISSDSKPISKGYVVNLVGENVKEDEEISVLEKLLVSYGESESTSMLVVSEDGDNFEEPVIENLHSRLLDQVEFMRLKVQSLENEAQITSLVESNWKVEELVNRLERIEYKTKEILKKITY